MANRTTQWGKSREEEGQGGCRRYSRCERCNVVMAKSVLRYALLSFVVTISLLAVTVWVPRNVTFTRSQHGHILLALSLSCSTLGETGTVDGNSNATGRLCKA